MVNGKCKAARKQYATAGARTEAGQALAEGAMVMMMIIPTALLLIMALVNIYAIMTYDTKLNFIATQAVKLRGDNLYWLGMPRADITAAEADQQAQNLAIAMAAAAGIQITASDVHFTSVPLTANGQTFSGVQCTITASNFRLPFGDNRVFPLIMPRTVSVTVAADAVRPPCVAQYNSSYDVGGNPVIGTVNPQGQNVSLFMPCYGALYQSNNVNPQTNQPSAVPTGNVPVPQAIKSKVMACVQNVGNAVQFISQNTN